MKSWTGKGAATRIYSPDFDADFSRVPRKIQEQIEEKLNAIGLRLARCYGKSANTLKERAGSQPWAEGLNPFGIAKQSANAS